MHRRVKRASTALHPVLAPAALGALALGAALDILAEGRPGALTWLSFWTIVGGVVFGTWCALFALADWVFFARLGEAGTSGLDGFALALVVGLYGLAALLRVDMAEHAPPPSAVVLEVVGAGLLLIKNWIGRELSASLKRRE